MKKTFVFFAFVLVSCVLEACGAAQTPDPASCARDLNDIRTRESVCDPSLFGAFEDHAAQWLARCGEVASDMEKKEVENQVEVSRNCTEAERKRMEQCEACSRRFHDAGKPEDCLGDACPRALEEMKRILAECGDPALLWNDADPAREAVRRIEKRILEEQTLGQGLKALGETVEQAGALVDHGEMEKALTLLLDQLEKHGASFVEIGKESPLFPDRESTAAGFQEILKRSADAHADLASQDLLDPKTRKRPAEWMDAHRRLASVLARLFALNAVTLFPGSTDAIQATVERFQKDADKQAKAETRQMTSSAKRTLSRSASQCRKLNKAIVRLEGKVTQYEAKGQAKKVAAYRAKLDLTRQNLTNLYEDIKKALSMNALPEAQTQRFLEKLRKAGCPQGTVRYSDAASEQDKPSEATSAAPSEPTTASPETPSNPAETEAEPPRPEADKDSPW